MIYCIVPAELADELHEPLRRQFLDDPEVEVVVEQRRAERRRGERRSAAAGGTGERRGERRRIRNPADAGGRRIAERRAVPLPAAVSTARLPRRARRHLERLSFVERFEPTTEAAEDLETARLVTRIQAGDRSGFETLYLRYFNRVYSYLRLALNDSHEAEDVAQEVFLEVLEALPRYELRSAPFRAWLFRIARNRSINRLRRRGRIELEEPDRVERRAERSGALHDHPAEVDALAWISDRDLLILVERLPAAQRQLVALRYLMGLNMAEIAEAMDRSPAAVRQLHRRAIVFLQDRLAAARARPARRRQPARTITRQAWVVRSRRFALGRPR